MILAYKNLILFISYAKNGVICSSFQVWLIIPLVKLMCWVVIDLCFIDF
jgi:hypothetical protein